MSGRRSKKQRQAQRNRPAHIVNAETIARSADAVLGVNLSDLPFMNRTAQVVMGLCRAAFAQSKAIATLAEAGLLSATAPNRRLVAEVALRLHWLEGLSRDERRKAADTMLEKDRTDTEKLVTYLQEAGQEVDFDLAEMSAFKLDAASNGSIHQQTTRLWAAVESSEVKPWSIYSMWLEETIYAHASGALAGKYAPTHDDVHMSTGTPEPMDPDLEAHPILQMLIVTTTGRILMDEGLPEEFARRVVAAFFSV